MPVVAVVLSSYLALGTIPVEISIDASSATVNFPHNWKNSFGSGHALLATRADWRAHLKRCVTEIGLKGIRMHGILDDDMSVTPDGKTFYFYNVDKVFDALVAEGVNPIVELSFMPQAIAKDKTAFAFRDRGGYKGYTTPPISYDLWYSLIKAFAAHLLDRYGLEVLSQWWFEVC